MNSLLTLYLYHLDSHGAAMPCVLVQYLFDKEEHEMVHLKPHGNSKSLLTYKRLFSSTLELTKNSEGQPKKSSIRFIARSVMSSM